MKHNKNIELKFENFDADIPSLGPFDTADITRGTVRHLKNLGYSLITEFKLQSKRRVDLIGLDNGSRFIIIEVKSSVNDFKSDKKWHEYIPFADEMYFAVANGFPLNILPNECGIIIADAYNAAIVKPSQITKITINRRRAQILQFAHTAAKRLQKIKDPNI